ncbi:hypothetical protein EDD11_006627 [Mortierella claussenii]|nr:hypothetical protein EDD11_006627 [Mortierella claussenii]
MTLVMATTASVVPAKPATTTTIATSTTRQSSSPGKSQPLPWGAVTATSSEMQKDRRQRHIVGWPSSLDIEIDKLDLGGLSMPFTYSVFQNTNTGVKNFGNVQIVSAPGMQASAAGGGMGEGAAVMGG